MYSKIEGGTTVNIQGLDCHIPPVGYVFNIMSGKLEKRDIISRSHIPSEQYWERKPLPEWYKKVSKDEEEYEKRRKDDDPPFYDERLAEYVKTEWDRRLNGCWFMNNGSACYITGMHYMFMQWWQIDIGYPRFRIPDMEYFYFLQCCIEDPNSMGMIEITKRRFGKTFRGGLFLTEYVTRTRMANAGIQSKTGTDAKKVFLKAVVSPFKRLPKFFRPEYDMSSGVTPKSALSFQQTNVKGKKAEEVLDKEELGSLIDHQSADEVAYDGQKIHRYFSDEWCKTLEANIFDRHEVVRYCLLDDEGKIIGKALYSSTVERLKTEKEGVQEAAKKLWDNSDHTNKMENGKTPSGLYRFFMTADRARNFDAYGYPDVEKTVAEILADRKSVAHDPRALAARMRKEARTIEEAWMSDGEKCIFNAVRINERSAQLKEKPPIMRKVLFYRKDENTIGWREVEFSDFYWEITQFPEDDKANKFEYKDRLRFPSRTNDGVIGIDSYSNSQGGKKYGSKACAWIGRRLNAFDEDNTGKVIGRLYGRPSVKDTLHEQVMLAAEYYGYQAFYEHTADDYESYFRQRGKINYLGLYPLNLIDPLKIESTERYRGTPITPYSLTKQHDLGISYFEHNCHKIDWLELLDVALQYDPYKRTEFDQMTSFLITLAAMVDKPPMKPKMKQPLIREYARTEFATQ